MKNYTLLFFLTVSCVPGLIRPTEPVHHENQTQSTPTSPVVVQQPMISTIDHQTFRFRMREDQVWNAAIDVLMKNYNLTIVDDKSGIITTEWDSFYLKGEVYRNKISIRLKQVGWNDVNLVVLNNVEALKTNNENAANSIWLPADDTAGEVSRIIKNIAAVLGQPAPHFQKGTLARGVEEEPISQE